MESNEVFPQVNLCRLSTTMCLNGNRTIAFILRKSYKWNGGIIISVEWFWFKRNSQKMILNQHNGLFMCIFTILRQYAMKHMVQICSGRWWNTQLVYFYICFISFCCLSTNNNNRGISKVYKYDVIYLIEFLLCNERIEAARFVSYSIYNTIRWHPTLGLRCILQCIGRRGQWHSNGEQWKLFAQRTCWLAHVLCEICITTIRFYTYSLIWYRAHSNIYEHHFQQY